NNCETMMTRSKTVGTFAAAAMLAGLIGAPLVAAATDIVKTRIAGFHNLGTAYKAANDQLKSDAPQLPVIRTSALAIQKYAGQLKGWFPAGSGARPGGTKTAAKPEIWQQAAA